MAEMLFTLRNLQEQRLNAFSEEIYLLVCKVKACEQTIFRTSQIFYLNLSFWYVCVLLHIPVFVMSSVHTLCTRLQAHIINTLFKQTKNTPPLTLAGYFSKRTTSGLWNTPYYHKQHQTKNSGTDKA